MKPHSILNWFVALLCGLSLLMACKQKDSKLSETTRAAISQLQFKPLTEADPMVMMAPITLPKASAKADIESMMSQLPDDTRSALNPKNLIGTVSKDGNQHLFVCNPNSAESTAVTISAGGKMCAGDLIPVITLWASTENSRRFTKWFQMAIVLKDANQDPTQVRALPTLVADTSTPSPNHIDPGPARIVSSGGPNPQPMIITMSMSPGSSYRDGNQMINSEGSIDFEYIEREPKVFEMAGKFFNGFLADGSVLIDDNDQVIGICSQFGRLILSRWRKISAINMELTGYLDVAGQADLPADLASAVKYLRSTVHTIGARNELIKSLEYRSDRVESKYVVSIQPSSVDALLQQPPAPFEPSQFYPTGARVSIDAQRWIVIESNPKAGLTRLLSDTVRNQAANGQALQSVFETFPLHSSRLREIGTTSDYLELLAHEIDDLGDKKIAEEQQRRQLLNAAEKQMKIAETKARQVGAAPVFNADGTLNLSGYSKEALKPLLAIGANAVTDALYEPKVAAAGVQALGFTPGGTSIVKAISDPNTPLGRRLTAIALASIADGFAAPSSVISEHLAKGDALKAFKIWVTASALSSPIHILRGVGALIPIKGADFFFQTASGVAMRYRKIKTEESMGYENDHFVANLSAGGATATLMYVATANNWGAGRTKAIGQVGFLASEIISGRGYAGPIAGTLVEIGTNLLVVHPLIRPFAMTLAGQVNALVQLGSANHALAGVSSHVDAIHITGDMWRRKINAMVFLIRMDEALLTNRPAISQNFILAMLKDPNQKFNEFILAK